MNTYSCNFMFVHISIHTLQLQYTHYNIWLLSLSKTCFKNFPRAFIQPLYTFHFIDIAKPPFLQTKQTSKLHKPINTSTISFATLVTNQLIAHNGVLLI